MNLGNPLGMKKHNIYCRGPSGQNRMMAIEQTTMSGHGSFGFQCSPAKRARYSAKPKSQGPWVGHVNIVDDEGNTLKELALSPMNPK